MRAHFTVLLGLLALPVTGMAAVPVCTTGTISEIPSTLGWFEIPNTRLRDVCPPNDFGGVSYSFEFHCKAVTDSWSGGALDPSRNLLLIWGGGHGDYYGNEIYALDLNLFRMCRLTDPATPFEPYNDDVYSEMPPNDGTQPNGRHTYGGLAFMADTDRMWALGGSLNGRGIQDSATWLFDTNDARWRRQDRDGPTNNPSRIISAHYDTVTGKVFFHTRNALYSYEQSDPNDTSSGFYTQLSDEIPTIGFHTSAVIDPVRRKFLVLGGPESVELIYDIGDGSNYVAEDLNSTGDNGFLNQQGPGLAYEPVLDKIIAWTGGKEIHLLDLDTRVWVSQTLDGSDPGPAFDNGTFGRWRYVPSLGVFVVYNHVDDNAFTLRLVSNGGAAQGPAVFFSSAADEIPTGQSTTLSWFTHNADECEASGDWNGPRPTSGSVETSALQTSQRYTLTCTTVDGLRTSRDVTVAVGGAPLPPPSSDPSPNPNLTAPAPTDEDDEGDDEDGDNANSMDPLSLLLLNGLLAAVMFYRRRVARRRILVRTGESR